MRKVMIFGALLLALTLVLVLMPIQAQEEPALRIGMLPVLNRLPLTIAEAAGFFEEEGVSVALLRFPSSASIQRAALAGEIDGFQADLVSMLKVMEQGGDLRLVRHVGITNAPFFALIAAQGSEIQSVEDLRGRSIAISQGTVVQYIADSLLASAGIGADEVEYLDSPAILERMERLLEGDYELGVFPQNFLGVLESFGGQILLEDSVVDYVPEAIGFTAATLEAKGEAVRALLAAYERAVALLNDLLGGRAAFEALLDEVGLREDHVAGDLVAGKAPVPRLSRAGVPDEAQVAAVQEWALQAGLIAEARAYADLVDGAYLPAVSEEEQAAEDARWAEAAAAEVTETELASAPADITFLYVSMIPDFLPFTIAQGAGYFAEAGVNVELVELTVDPSLGEEMLGEYDGRYGTVMDVISLNAAGHDFRVARSLPVLHAILLKPGSELQSLVDLRGATFSQPQSAPIQFLLERYLASAGLSVDDVEFAQEAAADQGPLAQFQFLMGGVIDAALMFEPFVSIGAQYGARVLADATALEHQNGVMLFKTSALTEKGEAVRAFLAAYERAVDTLIAMAGDADAFRAFSDEIGLEHSQASYNIYSDLTPLPTFATVSVPDEAYFTEMHDWLLANGHISEALAYEDVVDGSFLPAAMAADESEEE